MDLHAALKTTVLSEFSENGIHYKHVRLQHSKESVVNSLHARPSTHTTAGIQSTDFLHFLGFRRAECAFFRSECFCRELLVEQDVHALAVGIGKAFQNFDSASRDLEACGIPVDQPEGWGFFYGKPGSARRRGYSSGRGNGHVAPKIQKLKESEDEFFRFVLTWMEGGGDKGWTTHYRAKHMPLAPEFEGALNFLGGFSWFKDCPEFEFEGCWWRFMDFQPGEDRLFGGNADFAHRSFDAHATRFASGLKGLLAAHAELMPFGITFLSVADTRVVAKEETRHGLRAASPRHTSITQDQYDVAISFAGTEREYADELARLLRDAGLAVFYDAFYPEQLWGKDLAAFFDRIYRKQSRYCVMFVSKEYSDRMWTTHERRSAQARALQERGREYILPVRCDATDLDGLPPTVGYLSLTEYPITKIAELLIKKLKSS